MLRLLIPMQPKCMACHSRCSRRGGVGGARICRSGCDCSREASGRQRRSRLRLRRCHRLPSHMHARSHLPELCACLHHRGLSVGRGLGVRSVRVWQGGGGVACSCSGASLPGGCGGRGCTPLRPPAAHSCRMHVAAAAAVVAASCASGGRAVVSARQSVRQSAAAARRSGWAAEAAGCGWRLAQLGSAQPQPQLQPPNHTTRKLRYHAHAHACEPAERRDDENGVKGMELRVRM